MRNERRLVYFEFTLALYKATGKFFVCQDAIGACSDLIRNVWYWRVPMKTSPPRAVAKVLGRLARHVRASARAVIVRAPVFTRVSPQWRGKGSSCTQAPFICWGQDFQEAILWPDPADASQGRMPG